VAELLIVMASVGSLAGLALLVLFMPWQMLIGLAIGAMALGVFAGIPAGLYYHVTLRRELVRLGKLEQRWWWRPHDYHQHLDAAARRRVMPWWFVGAGGFAVIVLGFALTLLAVATAP